MKIHIMDPSNLNIDDIFLVVKFEFCSIYCCQHKFRTILNLHLIYTHDESKKDADACACAAFSQRCVQKGISLGDGASVFQLSSYYSVKLYTHITINNVDSNLNLQVRINL